MKRSNTNNKDYLSSKNKIFRESGEDVKRISKNFTQPKNNAPSHYNTSNLSKYLEDLARDKYEKFGDPFFRNQDTRIVDCEQTLISAVMMALNGRLIKCLGSVFLRDDYKCIWTSIEIDILTYLERYIDAQGFRLGDLLKNHVNEEDPERSPPFFIKRPSQLKQLARNVYENNSIHNDDNLVEKIKKNCFGLVNFKNGTFDLKRGKWLGATQIDQYYFCTTNYDFPDPNHIDTKEKVKVLSDFFLKFWGEDNLKWGMTFLGRTLAGHGVKDRKICFVHGPRSGAKGTTFSLIGKAFGDYACDFDPSFLMCTREDVRIRQHDLLARGMAQLTGAMFRRLLLAKEIAHNENFENTDAPFSKNKEICLNGHLLKPTISGGDSVSVRKLYEEMNTVFLSSTIMFQSNGKVDTVPENARNNILYFATAGRWIEKMEYDQEINRGFKNIYLRDVNVRDNLIDKEIYTVLPLILSQFFQKDAVDYPRRFFWSKEREESVEKEFLDLLRFKNYCSVKTGEFTPNWKIKAFFEKFRIFLPPKTTKESLLYALWHDNPCVPASKRCRRGDNEKIEKQRGVLHFFLDDELLKKTHKEVENEIRSYMDDRAIPEETNEGIKEEIVMIRKGHLENIKGTQVRDPSQSPSVSPAKEKKKNIDLLSLQCSEKKDSQLLLFSPKSPLRIKEIEELEERRRTLSDLTKRTSQTDLQ
jgi:hypothetical protein